MRYEITFAAVRLFLAFAAFEHLVSGSHAARRHLDAVAETYDYIIVGGGTSGLVLANRLSENAEKTVLVVEYGDYPNNINVTVPFFTTYDQSARLYNITSVPQAHLGNRSSRLRLGATVGGSSSVNGMAWDRGSAADCDAWEALGNPGWGWKTFLKYFRRSSSFEAPAAEYVEKYGYEWSPDAYGDGPVKVGFPSWQWPAADLQAQAWSEDIKVPKLRDGAAGDNVGIAWLPQNSGGKNATRSSAETAYFKPVSKRKNLHLIVRHYGGRVNFEGNCTAGIEIFSREGSKRRFVRSNNVVLAAGAVNTPRILQLSGIGPRELLGGLGIEIIVDSPGVGANFQDHPAVFMVYNFTNNSAVNPTLMTNDAFYNKSWAEYRAAKTGPHTHSWGNKVVFTSLQELDDNYKALASPLASQDPLQHLPHIYSQSPELLAGYKRQLSVLTDQFLNPRAGVVEFTFGGAQNIPVSLQKPLSRGKITINTTNPDPSIAPLVDFNTLSHPIDAVILSRAVAKARQFMSAPSVRSLVAVEVLPGVGATSDSEIQEVMRREWLSSSFDHPVGTAAMMPREWGGVVDRNLRVYGVEGLWVVDASVMPVLPAAHTQATVYAVAEHAADIIKAGGL
ncbi:choline dehydrogenase [Colletotrichum plurivorum]|uniref:Choline dehydrogenase n=1 Tax=Colletotrichum plurivorum TaxID=2175906 RepID=A0A8H6N2F3_9PEZI|nr:choline dehydrogenase [Colletotrichum plurivorum]